MDRVEGNAIGKDNLYLTADSRQLDKAQYWLYRLTTGAINLQNGYRRNFGCCKTFFRIRMQDDVSYAGIKTFEYQFQILRLIQNSSEIYWKYK